MSDIKRMPEKRSAAKKVLIVMILLAAAVWLAVYAVPGTEAVYAAEEKATVGKPTGGGSVDKMDSISLGTVDLTKVKDDTVITFKMAVKFEKAHNFYYDSIFTQDDKPDVGAFTCSDIVNVTSYNMVTFDVKCRPSDLSAGKYTANVAVPLDNSVNANGGTLKCVKDGDGYLLLIPVSITLTGENPRFLPAVKTLSTEAWDGAVEIQWKAPDYDITVFSIYRRDGKDASPSRPDLDKYVKLSEVNTEGSNEWLSEPGFGSTSFTDHFAENGKTYSYIIISGSWDHQYSGNPSKSVSAAAKASLRKKPAPPYGVGLKSADDGIGLSWSWNEKGGQRDPVNGYYEEQNPAGEGEVDHFNIYQNGRLVKQVQQKAIETSEYNGYTYYTWSTRVKVDEFNVPYSFHITAVAPDGTESAKSSGITAYREEERDVYLDRGFYVYYSTEEVHDEEDYDKIIAKYTGFDFKLNGIGVDHYKMWRKPAGEPDSSFKEINITTTPHGNLMDTTVKKGSVYTYKVIGIASDGQETDPVVFNVAADANEWGEAPGGSYLLVSFRTHDGESAVLSWDAYRDGTYSLYRDGKLIKSWKDPVDRISFADDPGKDGRFEYQVTWADNKYPDAAAESNKVLFVRDTSDPDPDSFDKAPGKPKLTGRVQGTEEYSTLRLKWEPSEDGGNPDGYVIYRTDGGIYNTSDWNHSLSWGNPKRAAGESANGRFWCTRNTVTDYSMYDFKTVNDEESSGLNPHKIWIVAYNEVGYSEPSEVLEYVSTEDGILPWDVDDSAPGAPENVSAKVVWALGNNYVPLDLDGRLVVTWGAPSAGGTIDHYDVEFYHPGYTEGDMTIYENTEKHKIPFGNEQKCETYLYDYQVGLPFTITVKAVNSKGEASAEPLTTVVTSIPALKAEVEDVSSVKLSWKGLHGSEEKKVKEFQFFRRANSSKWEKFRTIPYGEPGDGDDWTHDEYSGYSLVDSGLAGSTTYEYYVSAIDQDGKAHKSAVSTAELNNMDAPLGAPKDLKAKNADGDVILSWTPSDTGGLPAYYRLYYQTAESDPEHDRWYNLDIVDSFGMSTGAAVTSMDLNSYGDELSEMIKDYGGQKMRMYVRAIPAKTVSRDWSEPSNTIEFTWPTEDQVKHDKEPPEPITPEAIPGDGKVTLKWDKRTDLLDGEPEATYYQVLKTWGRDYGVVATFPADRASYEWVDTDVVNGEKYTYELRPCSSYYHSYYSSKWWYHPWCYMHQVEAIPNGRTAEQKAADNIKAFAEELLASKPSSSEDITDEYHDKVLELEESMAGTNAYQRRLIGKDLCQQIEDLVNEVLYNDTAKKYAGDPKLAAAVGSIDALDTYPKDIELEDEGFDAFEQAVKDARAAYKALPDDEKKLVSNYDKLTEREAYIKKLRRDAADQEKADILSDKMAALVPENITDDTLTDELERSIRDLRWEYDSMTKSQKARVRTDALENLAAAEDVVRQINGGEHKHVMQLVDAVPPTCITSGSTAYYRCVKCGACSSDAAGEKMIDEHDTVLAPDPDAHKWGEWEEVTGDGCIAEGAKRRRCELCGAEETDPEDAANHQWDGGTVVRPATQYEAGLKAYVCSVCGSNRTEVIPMLDPEVRLSASSYTWSGKVKTPAVTVLNGGAEMDPATYTVTMPAGRKNVGTYTVSVTFRGDYSGTIFKDFNIVPKGTSVSKLVRGKKGFTAKWKQQKKKMSKARVTGYKIQYSLKKSMKSGKTVTIKGWKKKSAKFTKLKAGKTYYVRIRTYMKAGGRTICSKWSKPKKVKTK